MIDPGDTTRTIARNEFHKSKQNVEFGSKVDLQASEIDNEPINVQLEPKNKKQLGPIDDDVVTLHHPQPSKYRIIVCTVIL